MTRTAAFFDVDGTLTRSDVFRDLVAFRAHARAPLPHALWMTAHPLRGLSLLALDRISRPAVNRLTSRWYRGHAPEELSAFAEEFQASAGMKRLRRGAFDLLLAHARLGHRLAFITGSIDLFVQPFVANLERDLAEALRDLPHAGPVPDGHRARGDSQGPSIRLEAIELEQDEGRFTGRLACEPVGGAVKARLVERIARDEGIDLARSHAYGDSIADLPLLESVGRPAAVSPDRRLRRVARRRGWPVLPLDPPDERTP